MFWIFNRNFVKMKNLQKESTVFCKTSWEQKNTSNWKSQLHFPQKFRENKIKKFFVTSTCLVQIMRHFCHLASFNPTHYLYFTFSYFSENMILEHCSGIMRQTLMAKTFATMWNLHIEQVRENLQKSIMHFSSFVIFKARASAPLSSNSKIFFQCSNPQFWLISSFINLLITIITC